MSGAGLCEVVAVADLAGDGDALAVERALPPVEAQRLPPARNRGRGVS